MSTTVSVAGSSYSVPAEGDNGWANDVTNLLIQLATSTKVLQSSTSSFPLLSELDFGSSYGLKSLYFKSRATNPSSSGIVRLGNNESIGFRNAANNADLLLKANASNILEFNGNAVLDAGGSGLTGLITNAMVSASAAIDYSKLNLATSIVNADISASAAIAYSKLNLSTSILNSDINASANIARSKLAALTASRAMVTDGSGNDSASAVTSTELGYLSGTTSAIQTQLDSKVTKSLTTTKGDLIVATGASTPARLAVGLDGYSLVADSTQASGVKWGPTTTPLYSGAIFQTSVPQASNTILPITSVNFDDYSGMDLVNNWFLIPTTKIYTVSARASFGFNTGVASYAELRLYVNGGFVDTFDIRTLTTTGYSGTVYCSGEIIASFTAGDMVQIVAYQNSAAANTITVGANIVVK